MASNAAPIIIKRKKGGHEGHHGGAWKVAYADFVTAMMAFFLLLWLLNSTTQEQRSGISDYFAPASVSRTTSGSGGLFGGQTVTLDGPQRGKGTPMGVPMPAMDNPPAEEDGEARGTASEGDAFSGQAEQGAETPGMDILHQREERQFDTVEDTIRSSLESLPGLRHLSSSLLIDRTDEGLRIQIIDRNRNSMFPSGSAEPYQHTRQLLEVIAHALSPLPNRIKVEGHTDAVPFPEGSHYTNWELSSDRAHSSRRELARYGVAEERFTRVVGLAATEPLIAEDPEDARNRRIAITLLRETRPPPSARAGLREAPSFTPPPPVVEDARLPRFLPDTATQAR